MVEESQIKQDVRNACSQILYEDSRYIIGVDNRGADAHNLLVNDAYAFLDRGIFNELARADKSRLALSLRRVGERVLEEMVSKKIPLEELGWVLAKAAIREQEDYSNYLIEQKYSQ